MCPQRLKFLVSSQLPLLFSSWCKPGCILYLGMQCNRRSRVDTVTASGAVGVSYFVFQGQVSQTRLSKTRRLSKQDGCQNKTVKQDCQTRLFGFHCPFNFNFPSLSIAANHGCWKLYPWHGERSVVSPTPPRLEQMIPSVSFRVVFSEETPSVVFRTAHAWQINRITSKTYRRRTRRRTAGCMQACMAIVSLVGTFFLFLPCFSQALLAHPHLNSSIQSHQPEHAQRQPNSGSKRKSKAGGGNRGGGGSSKGGSKSAKSSGGAKKAGGGGGGGSRGSTNPQKAAADKAAKAAAKARKIAEDKKRKAEEAAAAAAELAAAQNPLTFDEKKALSVAINNLDQGNLTRVVEIIQARMPLGSSDEEIELDIDSMDNLTLRDLQAFIKEVGDKGGSRKAGGGDDSDSDGEQW